MPTNAAVIAATIPGSPIVTQMEPTGSTSMNSATTAKYIYFRLLLDLSRSALNSDPVFHSGHRRELARSRPSSRST